MNEMMPTWLLLSVFVWPLLLALVLMTGALRRFVLVLAPWAALPGLVVAFLMTPGAMLDLPWLLLGASLGLDETASMFLFFTSFLWVVAGVYASGYFKEDPSRIRFFIAFLLAMAGNLGLILAQDMVLFYTLFALMSFASYVLVVHTATTAAIRAGRIYIILVVVGEVLLFAAFAMAAQASGSLEFAAVRSTLAGADSKNWIIGLTLAGFGIKAGVIGLHVWLPLAHPVAPTPASAVLSGAMIAAGLLGWMRMLPLGEAVLTGWGQVMMTAGVVAIFYAVVVGLFQSNPKTVLAYSSISKMGLMTMAVGLGLTAPDQWPFILSAILVFVLHHGLAKGALFLGVGMAMNSVASKLQGYMLSAGLLLPALALAGAPWTSGMIAKHLLKAQVTSGASPWGSELKIALLLGSVAASLLMVRFLYLVWQQYQSASAAHSTPKAMWLSWSVLLLAVALNPWLIPLADAQDRWAVGAIVAAAWPVAVGSGLAVIVWFASTRRQIRYRFSIPSGDMLLIVEKWLWPALFSGLSLLVVMLEKVRSALLILMNRLFADSGRRSVFDVAEHRFRQWALGSVLFLILAVVFVFFASQDLLS